MLARNFAIDASALTGGLTLSGNNASRLFTVNSAQTVVLTGLTLSGGNGVGAVATKSGGAIYNNNGTLTLNQCMLANNAATIVGGAIRQQTGILTLNRCTVANNTANTSGANAGGIAGGTGTLTLNQCTFSGNSTVGVGGAASIASGGNAAVNQCTISGNQAGMGGGLNNAGTVTLANTIVAGNTAPTGADINNTGTLTRSGHDVIGNNTTVTTQFAAGSPNSNGDYVGTTASPVNPLLAPLDNYGGPTLTIALEPNSPARNAGTALGFTTDQRGFPIVGLPDIGAYEAGTLNLNYNAYIYETLPAGTAAAQYAATADYDGDGVSNYNEFLAQTSATDPTSSLRITQITRSGNSLTIVFPSVTGRNYTVESSTDLVAWTPLDGPPALPGTGSPITRSYVFASGAPPRYFVRVRGGP